MSDETRGARSLSPLLGAVGGILSNPAVLEGLIAGISAIGASRRVKNDGEPDTITNILSVLPQILPLISLFVAADPAKSEKDTPASESVPASAGFDSLPARNTDNSNAIGGFDGFDSVNGFDDVNGNNNGGNGSGGNGNGDGNGDGNGGGNNTGGTRPDSLPAGLFDGGKDAESGAGAIFGGDSDISYESPQSQRENLLLALRPFLSESRRSAADAMVQVNKMSGLFAHPGRGRGGGT